MFLRFAREHKRGHREVLAGLANWDDEINADVVAPPDSLPVILLRIFLEWLLVSHNSDVKSSLVGISSCQELGDTDTADIESSLPGLLQEHHPV